MNEEAPSIRHPQAVVRSDRSIPFSVFYRTVLLSALLAITGCKETPAPKDVPSGATQSAVVETIHPLETATEEKMRAIDAALERLQVALQAHTIESPLKEELEAFFVFFNNNKVTNPQRNSYVLERSIDSSHGISVSVRHFFYRVVEKTSGTAALYSYKNNSIEIPSDFDPEKLHDALIAEHEIYHAMNWFLRRQKNYDRKRFSNRRSEDAFYADKFNITEEARAFAFQLETMNVLSNGKIKALFPVSSQPHSFVDSDRQLLADLLEIPTTHADIANSLALASLYYRNNGTINNLPDQYVRAICGMYRDIYARNAWAFHPYTETPDGTLVPFSS